MFEALCARCSAAPIVALVTSGTATLETALAGVPHVIAYRTSLVTYAIGGVWSEIPLSGFPTSLPEAMVPECIQERSEAGSIAPPLPASSRSPELYNDTARRLIALREKLGEKKPSEEVSSIIKAVCGRSRV